ncbi:arginine--tRNA ligase [Chitinivorax sp. B]|uniref:arginine--tRNA ligase n=1 Tax=Chitinivorax sp. B TaxID=2502235 RepID=UPI0010F90DA1|nr:arginine--tRNA ligase [Chitinivorax sp. B]
MTLLQLLTQRFEAALAAAGAPGAQPLVQPAGKPEFGDYQVNGVMAAAKQLKMNPRELAQKVVDHAQVSDLVAKLDIAGPGFINLHLDPAYLARRVEQALADPKLGVPPQPKRKVMVEYSSPNVAKEMHVGHLRSTIIGDALARVQAFLGHEVLRANHVGDWGTQFGMLTAYLLEVKQGAAGDADMALNDLEEFYRQAKTHFDADAAFATRAREYVVKLQSGDPEVLALWRQFVDISLSHCEAVYRKLNVQLGRDDVRGESTYNDDLPVVVNDLRQQGLLTEDQGAQVVFLDEFKNKEGEALACIIQKSDGGYLYATTDLSAVRYRHNTLNLDRVMYVVDARQGLHFQQIFTIARKAGYAPENMVLEHVAFGTMMGEDGKPFKTRSGGTVKLVELLDEAEERAYQLVTDKNPALSEATRRQIAGKVGIGAVKYADLSKHRTSDYIFSWDSMLAFEGNTAPYLQYAYTRIRSIFGKGVALDANAAIILTEPAERALALQLAQFADAVYTVARDAVPHLMCLYLYQLATQFMRFYEACPVLKSEGSVQQSRLKLCDLTAKVMEAGLDMLGIEVMEAM